MSSRFVVASAVLWLLVGCEDTVRGTSQPAGPDGGPFVVSTIRFRADEPPAPGTVWLELENADPQTGRFTLRLAGDGLEAYGVAGRLTFGDQSRCRFVEATEGEALGGEGASVLALARATDTELVLGFSRTGDQQAATLRPEAAIGRLVFEAHFDAPGECRFAWVPRHATALSARLERMRDIPFVGGTVTVE
jgi:hypothetical protein